jgi:DNA-binding beta-propeller fold protein YncE
VGAEVAGQRAGQLRYTKILFGANYFDGRPDPGTRIDPNNPEAASGNQHWPNVPQPFRSWPNALALTPIRGQALHCAGRTRRLSRLARRGGRHSEPNGQTVDRSAAGGIAEGDPTDGNSLVTTNTAVFIRPYAVVLNEYANFASVIDTGSDTVVGEFQTGFYGEDLVFNATGTRLYLTDRFKDQVRAFRIDPGPTFTQIAEIPTGRSDLERASPRDLDLSPDGRTLCVANTLGHTIAVIDVAGDANILRGNLVVGGLATDVKIAGRWGIVSGHETNTVLNGPDSGDGLPKFDRRRNDGSPLGYTPVMTDATRAMTFDDLGSELNVFEVATNQFVQRYVDIDRDKSMLAVPGQITDLGDYRPDQEIIRGSGPEQIVVHGNFRQPDAFRQGRGVSHQSGRPSTMALAHVGTEFTGGVTPQGIAVAPDGFTVYVANMQAEDVSLLGVDANGPNGRLTRQGYLAVGVTGKTPYPTRGGNGQNLFATAEEIGLRWFFTQSYSDDGQKSCGHCHWQSRHDGSQWNVGANAVGGVKVCPQNKDISDNWPEWFEGLNNDMTAYASARPSMNRRAARHSRSGPRPDRCLLMLASNRVQYRLRRMFGAAHLFHERQDLPHRRHRVA